MSAGRYLSALLLTICLAACRADVPSTGTQQMTATEGSGAAPQTEILKGAQQTIGNAIDAKKEVGDDVFGAILHKGMKSTTLALTSTPLASSTPCPSSTPCICPISSAPLPPSSTPAKSTTLPQTSTAIPTTSPPPTTPQGSSTPPSTTKPPGPPQCMGSDGMSVSIDNSTCAPAASANMACPTSTTFCSTPYITNDVITGSFIVVAQINSNCDGMGACSTTNGTEALECINTSDGSNTCSDTSGTFLSVACGTSASGLGRLLYQDSTGVGNCTSDVDCITTPGANSTYACVEVDATAGTYQCVLPAPVTSNCAINSAACFPPDAIVRIKGGQIKTMEQVRIGDILQSISPDGLSIYEEVYMIAHEDPDTIAAFVTLHHADEDGGNNGVMKLTPDHYIAVGKSWAEHSMLPARSLQPAMHIFIASSEDGEVAHHVITKVERTVQRGLYAPFTMNGVLVVDDVVASAFTEIGAAGTLRMFSIDPAAAQQAAMAPVRFLYRVSGAALAIRCDSAQCSNHRVAAVLIMCVIMLGVSLAIAHAVAWWVVKEANKKMKMPIDAAKLRSSMMLKA